MKENKMIKIFATLSLSIFILGCQTGGKWSAKELEEWYVNITQPDSKFVSPLYYQGTDNHYHYFICRSMDTWVPVHVKKEEIRIEDIRPYVSTSQSINFPGYYKVDPTNEFKKL